MHRVKPAPWFKKHSGSRNTVVQASTAPLGPEVVMFRNRMPRYEILSPDAVAVLDAGWRRIVSEIGVQFAKPEAVELFRKAGQAVGGDGVRLDPEVVLEQVAKAPRGVDVHARHPANTLPI